MTNEPSQPYDGALSTREELLAGYCCECHEPMSSTDKKYVAVNGDICCSEDCMREVNFDFQRDL